MSAPLRLRCAARTLAVLALLLAGPGAAVLAEPPAAPPKPRDVSALLKSIRERHGVPGLAGAIVAGPALEAVGCDGVRSRGKPEAVTLEDRWHLGSCTKAMTATLCALLVEEKTLAWDTKLGAAFPDLARDPQPMDPQWKDVTLDLLLTHRAGVPSDLSFDGLWGRLWAREGTPAEQRMTLAKSVLRHPPVHAPGSKFLYSNAGFALAGVLAERAAKQDYEALIAKRLFGPLGMASAGFGAPGTPGKNDQPRGHGADGSPVEPGPQADNPPGIAPAGNAHMTIQDWAKFVALHLEGSRGRSALLGKASFEHLHTPPPGAEPPYVAGWIATERPWGGGTVFTHSGSNTMWFCEVWMAPARGFAVLACANMAGAEAEKACDEMVGTLLGEHLKEPPK